ncbi:hypothetical protein M8868_09150 [Pasteurella multocida]|uniref:DUF2570 domain-containing protein n=1 Tax=Pasteurella multocida TaxID=747 RepID=A0A9X3ZLE9_PASMD|nr:hypothetical protein [Pasteurella multocida]EPE66547.1 hypothetical protein I141_09460 [Pasteurella multocida P1933]ESQ71340.1 hypothetical protein P1062_0211410 [Pasteurella multocida subsp. multocida P1062]MBF6980591.1 hypothetical protein [Pasteurella multocida]MCL7761418.1 hypothetical protein [Pasteurella multocida]MCL7783041.1 hypothetical protein [Pasteurella multocida]
MNLKDYLIFVLLFFCTVFFIGASYYKSEYKTTAETLKTQVEKNKEQEKSIKNYEKNLKVLTHKLTNATAQAEQRAKALNEVLTSEDVKNWSAGNVPDDVRRLFNERQSDVGQSNLPQNDGMPRGKRAD